MNKIMEDTQTIDEMFNVYKKTYMGKDNKEKYKQNLSHFFDITLEIFVFGFADIPKKYGVGSWDRQQALDFWANYCNIKQDEVNKYFRSVDDVQPYT
jgi:hypothetical protein|tara:strand:+ start:184 stop:474 length:291 start_codon:yes stop_codon:yes gene_type:complete